MIAEAVNKLLERIGPGFNSFVLLSAAFPPEPARTGEVENTSREVQAQAFDIGSDLAEEPGAGKKNFSLHVKLSRGATQ